MNILLVNPPNSGKNIIVEKYHINVIRDTFRGEPLALEVLAGSLPTDGVDIFDMKADDTPYRQKLEEFAPELVGITCMTCEANTALTLLQATKAYNSRIITVVGGIHATNDPEFFNRPYVDYVVIGLGAKTFADLVGALKRGERPQTLPGIGVRTDSTFQITPKVFTRADLAEEALPNRNLVKKYRGTYRIGGTNIVVDFVDTAYGCTHRCHFCGLWKMTHGKYLAKTPDIVVRDIERCDALFVRLVDANTFGDLNRAKELASKIARKKLRKVFIVDARAETIANHPELIELWSQIGLKIVVIGFEEIHNNHLQAFHKKSTVELHTQAIKILHQHGVRIIGDFIVSPEYEESDFERLADYVTAQHIHFPGFSVLTPLPGTPLYEEMKSQVTLTDLAYYTLTNAVVPTKLPEKSFYEHVGALYQRFYRDSRSKQLLLKVFARESVIKVDYLTRRYLRQLVWWKKDTRL
ncbi:radical SAM protein [candidate division KSB3 bacterium]|uniref:Radical SAM protein n=1 Tax=candidate division KSB3 bacterium TaxID=2044937 RepID=A0A9D5Q4F5_9BACT|nr:radical SAM protein [candidate division KSB3 bacterium]MBD3323505.1 radical SAM protein [candidate division KSB3 bacterium]